ncbi:CIA30 domain-containing protein [Caenorhabditis elegans]|uniref:CIA30 domain-containing protein n=1 Tax=Caenorhabditis elegans TaxID=6239 RepID=G5ED19_CAEEL|nr:CIA30 domain-containing protein [Caenorhabditis elegans]CAA21571.3 CIA30 domain-containing protein [Caenorhabditis elegans]|eukprot:NP_509995.3 Uncharacterized protein CELE_Y62H9A.14 [Caenorhabditis elegans]
MGGAEGVLTTLSDCTTVGQYDWHQIPISFGDGSETVKYGFWLQTERGFIPNSFSFPLRDSAWSALSAKALEEDWSHLCEIPIAGSEEYGFKELVRIYPEKFDWSMIGTFLTEYCRASIWSLYCNPKTGAEFSTGPVFKDVHIEVTMFDNLLPLNKHHASSKENYEKNPSLYQYDLLSTGLDKKNLRKPCDSFEDPTNKYAQIFPSLSLTEQTNNSSKQRSNGSNKTCESYRSLFQRRIDGCKPRSFINNYSKMNNIWNSSIDINSTKTLPNTKPSQYGQASRRKTIVPMKVILVDSRKEHSGCNIQFGGFPTSSSTAWRGRYNELRRTTAP